MVRSGSVVGAKGSEDRKWREDGRIHVSGIHLYYTTDFLNVITAIGLSLKALRSFSHHTFIIATLATSRPIPKPFGQNDGWLVKGTTRSSTNGWLSSPSRTGRPIALASL